MLEQMNGNFEYDNNLTIHPRYNYRAYCIFKLLHVCLFGQREDSWIKSYESIYCVKKHGMELKSWKLKNICCEKFTMQINSPWPNRQRVTRARWEWLSAESIPVEMKHMDWMHGKWITVHHHVFWWRMIINILNCDRNSIFSNGIEECEMQIFCVQI